MDLGEQQQQNVRDQGQRPAGHVNVPEEEQNRRSGHGPAAAAVAGAARVQAGLGSGDSEADPDSQPRSDSVRGNRVSSGLGAQAPNRGPGRPGGAAPGAAAIATAPATSLGRALQPAEGFLSERTLRLRERYEQRRRRKQHHRHQQQQQMQAHAARQRQAATGEEQLGGVGQGTEADRGHAFTARDLRPGDGVVLRASWENPHYEDQLGLVIKVEAEQVSLMSRALWQWYWSWLHKMTLCLCGPWPINLITCQGLCRPFAL